MWEVEGAEYAEKLPEVIRLLTHASSTDEALIDIGALLDVDEAEAEAEAMVRLARFDLRTLTRAATERRLHLLAEPRTEQPLQRVDGDAAPGEWRTKRRRPDRGGISGRARHPCPNRSAVGGSSTRAASPSRAEDDDPELTPDVRRLR
jgi:hypothetical protein